ncbi:MAG TPA: hypothetical protein VN408_24885 [Actinoplanes sp.]|nr:hypothetical protein [Actinoplanes sp.]
MLTAPVSRVALPVHARQRHGYGPALETGAFAVDPLPHGQPWRRWADVADGEALGWFAPRFSVFDGPGGWILLSPADVRGAVLDLSLVSEVGCCGLAGSEPNMTCTACGTPVANRIDDCDRRPAVWLDPRTVRVLDDGPGPQPPLDWAGLLIERPGIPPTEPHGSWDATWRAAAGSAVAHLLAATGGEPIRMRESRVAAIFRFALDQVTVPGPEHTLTLAGPGLPAPGGELALVPVHPQTGEWWPVDPPVTAIPLDWDVWSHLAHYPDTRPAGRSVPLPPEAERELLPGRFVPDGEVFMQVLARLPEVRLPALRAVYERGLPYSYSYFNFDPL